MRKQGGRGGGRHVGSDESHFERRARRKRARARSHLERARGRGESRVGPARFAAARGSGSRTRRLVLFALSLAAGVLLSGPISDLVARRWHAEARAADSLAIQGGRRLSSPEIAGAAGLLPETELSQVDVGEIERRLESHPWVRDARALRLPTGALLLRVVERVPRAVLAGSEDTGFRLVDERGRPFAPAAASEIASLPRLRSSAYHDGASDHAPLADAVGVIDALAAHGVGVGAEGTAGPFELELPGTSNTALGWLLRLRGGELQVALGHGALGERIARLASLLRSQIEPEATSGLIDLRFSDRAILSAATRDRAPAAALGSGSTAEEGALARPRSG